MYVSGLEFNVFYAQPSKNQLEFYFTQLVFKVSFEQLVVVT